MTQHQMLLAAAGLVLAAISVFLALGGRDIDKRLKQRVLASRDLKREKSNEIGLLVEAPVNTSLLIRAAKLLGYRPELPGAFAASMRTIPLIAVVIGLGAFRLALLALNPAVAVLAGVGVALVCARFLFRRKSKAYTKALFQQIPDAMSLMLRAVRAGLPVAEAIRSVSSESMSPTREEFSRVAGETALGMPTEQALQRLYERTRIQEYAFFAVVIALQSQTGGNLAETLDNLADMVRRRVAMVAKARALSAEGRISIVIVGGLPFAVGAMMAVVSPDYMGEFLTNPSGPTFIVAFFVLLALGIGSTNLLIQKSMQD